MQEINGKQGTEGASWKLPGEIRFAVTCVTRLNRFHIQLVKNFTGQAKLEAGTGNWMQWPLKANALCATSQVKPDAFQNRNALGV